MRRVLDADGDDSVARARREVERWFVARGVPQLIEGYASEPAMDARATPLIAGWLVIGTVAHWGTRAGWPLAWNVVAVAGTLAWFLLGWFALATLRSRSPVRRPATIDLLDIVGIAFLPAIPAALIEGSAREALTATLGALTGIGIVYVVVGFGLVEIAGWALRRVRSQLAGIARLLAGTLPLLLILVVFALFAAELWEAAARLELIELVAVLALLLLVAILLVAASASGEIRLLEFRADWTTITAEAEATPATPLIPLVHTGNPPALSWLERANLVILALISQLLPAFFVAGAVWLTLLVFGLLVLPAPLIESWTGLPLDLLLEIDLLGERRLVSTELLSATSVLAGIVGLYFTGFALADATHRPEHFGRTMAEIETILSVRAVYRATLSAVEPGPDVVSPPPPRPTRAADASSPARSRKPAIRSNRGS